MSYIESKESSIGFERYWLILKRHSLPAAVVFVIVFALTLVALLLQKPVYEAQGKLLFQKVNPTSSYTGLGKDAGEMDALQQENSPVDTQAEVIRSFPIIDKAIARLELKDKNGAALKPEQLLRQLNVSSIRKTDVLAVVYRDTDPQKAADVVNTVMATYLENNLLANRGEAVAAREFVQKQLPKAESSLRQAESKLRRFKEENKVVALDEEAKASVSLVTDLQRQITATETGLADAKAQSELLRKQLGSNLQVAQDVTSISQFPAIQAAIAEIQEVESQLAVERSRFQEGFPTIVSLKRKKASLENLLQQRLKQVYGKKIQTAGRQLQNSGFDQKLTEDFVKAEARRLGLLSQMAALADVKAAYQDRLSVLPKLEQQQQELERQLQASQSTYLLLLQKLQEIRIAENQNTGNARVIAAATLPNEPVAPRKALFLVTGILLGGMLAVATALLLEKIDKSIRTVEDAKKIFDFPLLGLIPKQKSERFSPRLRSLERSTPEIAVRDSPRSLVSQSYRMLQANLKFLNSDTQIKTIAIASSVPKEGKSTVSANLAVAMAQMGRRVLLVDADMHRPLQHKIWELPNNLGLSNIIVGQTEPKTAIKKISANLHVLTAGVVPPNPMALLDSQRMASLMNIFSANYDYTIVDTPALNCAADAAIIGKMTDGMLLVVRPGVVDSVSATRAKEFLAQTGQHVLGQAINGFDPKHEPYSYYYDSDGYEGEDNTAPEYSSLKIRERS